jgi:hypothetical protein
MTRQYKMLGISLLYNFSPCCAYICYADQFILRKLTAHIKWQLYEVTANPLWTSSALWRLVFWDVTLSFFLAVWNIKGHFCSGSSVPRILWPLRPLDPQDEGEGEVLNTENHLPSDTASNERAPDFISPAVRTWNIETLCSVGSTKVWLWWWKDSRSTIRRGTCRYFSDSDCDINFVS